MNTVKLRRRRVSLSLPTATGQLLSEREVFIVDVIGALTESSFTLTY